MSGLWGMVMLQPQFQKRYDEFALGAEFRSLPFVIDLIWAKPGFDNNYSFRLSSQNEGYEEMYRKTPFRLELNSCYTGFDWRFSLNMYRRFPYIKDFIDFTNKSRNLCAQWQEAGVEFWNSWGDVVEMTFPKKQERLLPDPRSRIFTWVLPRSRTTIIAAVGSSRRSPLPSITPSTLRSNSSRGRRSSTRA